MCQQQNFLCPPSFSNLSATKLRLWFLDEVFVFFSWERKKKIPFVSFSLRLQNRNSILTMQKRNIALLDFVSREKADKHVTNYEKKTHFKKK